MSKFDLQIISMIAGLSDMALSNALEGKDSDVSQNLEQIRRGIKLLMEPEK